MANQEAQRSEVARLLDQAHRILFITGAGMSADSGLPTYRGIGGLYDDRLTDDDLAIEEALSGGMLLRRPAVTWKYLLEIERACRGGQPNRGHEVIAEIERHKPETWVLTQNVDGFHRAVGSRNLIEIHGRISILYCLHCDYRADVTDYREIEAVPVCPDCSGPIRPDVVLFGELLPREKQDTLFRELRRGFDLIFSVGTSSIFPYIAQPVLDAHRAGIPTVEINPASTEISEYVRYRLRGRAAETLDSLWRGGSCDPTKLQAAGVLAAKHVRGR